MKYSSSICNIYQSMTMDSRGVWMEVHHRCDGGAGDVLRRKMTWLLYSDQVQNIRISDVLHYLCFPLWVCPFLRLLACCPHDPATVPTVPTHPWFFFFPGISSHLSSLRAHCIYSLYHQIESPRMHVCTCVCVTAVDGLSWINFRGVPRLIIGWVG